MPACSIACCRFGSFGYAQGEQIVLRQPLREHDVGSSHLPFSRRSFSAPRPSSPLSESKSQARKILAFPERSAAPWWGVLPHCTGSVVPFCPTSLFSDVAGNYGVVAPAILAARCCALLAAAIASSYRRSVKAVQATASSASASCRAVAVTSG